MRQLLVSAGVAYAAPNSVVAPGALAVIMRADGALVPLAPADTIADSDEIRFVMGTAGEGNIYSPWIKGVDIIGWAGNSYTAQTAQSTTADLGVVNAVADGVATLKLISSNQGQQQFPRKSATINVTTGMNPTQQAQAFMASFTGEPLATIVANPITDFPIVGCEWAVAQYAAGIITFTGSTFSLTLGTELGSFRTASENLDGSNGTILTVTAVAAPSLGYGDAEVLAQYENQLKGDKSFYNRVQQPNTPVSYIDVATPTTYDVYTLRVKNSTPGSIHGVDNIREISIAWPAGGAAPQLAFEAIIMPYVTSTPLAIAAFAL